jgi:hypothetical protein
MKAFLGFALLLGTLSAKADNFTLLIYETAASIQARNDPSNRYWQDFNQYAGNLQSAGVLRGGSAFKTGQEVRTVRLVEGTQSVSTGAHAKSNDVLGGYLVIEVADLDAAVSWAKRAPARDGLHIEVRPSQINPTMNMKK